MTTAIVSAPVRAARLIDTVAGMPPVSDPTNLYSDAGAGKLSDATKGALARVYVPNLRSNDVYVIDPATFAVIGKFKVGLNPQHVVPSWDLKTLWVANNAENTTKGSLTPIDPLTGKPGKAIAVDDPVQHVLHARRQGGDRRRRGLQAARLPRPGDDGAEVVAGDTAVRRHQPRRLLDRRPVRDLHLRVRRHAGQDRHGRAQGDRLPRSSRPATCRRTSASRPTARPSTSPT